MNVVIGSGLAAVGAIRALLKRGIRPVVLDIGRELPSDLEQTRRSMSLREPTHWSADEWRELGRNESTARRVPRKLVFGSGFFYAEEEAIMESWNQEILGSPPWSPARGGFSVGWGAAVLPPAQSDISDWPITRPELLENMRTVLEGVPLSEPDDELGSVFGRLRPLGSEVLPLTLGQRKLLERLRDARVEHESKRLLVGQSRLLTQAGDTSDLRCRMCGHCSSGCVYGSIYTAEQQIDRWIREEAVDYRRDATVFKLHESNDSVQIRFLSGGQVETLEADRVFLASGAVNTTRILLNSCSSELQFATVRRTGGSLHLFASASPLPVSWPEVNTQTSHFVSFRDESISRYWSHVQIGQPNELILKRLGLTHENVESLIGRARKLAASHMVAATQNLHSDHGPTYQIRISQNDSKVPVMYTTQYLTKESRFVARRFSKELSRQLQKVGLFRLPVTRVGSRTALSYHFGASFPMASQPTDANHTDTLGRPFGWQRVHAVDTSVLPAIPATTVGLLTMANAHRIAANAP